VRHLQADEQASPGTAPEGAPAHLQRNVDGSTGVRMQVWKGAIEMIKEKPVLASGALVGSVVLMVILGSILYKQTTGPVHRSEISVVEFVDGQNTLSVSRNGAVTVHTPQGSFKQNWDKSKLDNFFMQVTSNAQCFGNTEGSQVTVGLTWTSGTHVDCLMSEVDEEASTTMQNSLQEAYEAYNLLPTWQRDIYLGQIQQGEEEEEGAGPSPTPNVTPTPNPNPTATPAPTTAPTYVELTGCEEIEDEDHQRKTVVTNVLCVENAYQE